MAPSPTGFLHIGGVRTFLFNWLYARRRDGECLLRVENTDTSREVEESVVQIERSLSWLGIDWDGPTTFQLDRMERAGEEARRLVAEGSAYEDEGAIRIRMPDEGVTGWDDAIKGRIEFPNAELEDLVLVRSDGRTTTSRTRRSSSMCCARSVPGRPSMRMYRTCSVTTAGSSRSGTARSRWTSSGPPATCPRRS